MTSSFFPRGCPHPQGQHRSQAPGGGLHHRVATHQFAGSGAGHFAVREIPDQRLRPDCRGPAAAGLRRIDRKHSAHGLRTSFRLRRGVVRACAHGLHRRVRQLFFITPQLSHFVDAYPAISVDILPLPHFISLSKREADIVIALERPEHGPYVCCKLCDYKLQLYATQDYLDKHPPIRRPADLGKHQFISYVDDLAFSSELLYLANVLPGASANLRSTSVIAQFVAAQQGRSLAILPCFLAAQDPRLLPVLPQEITITRQFWMYCREDLRKLKRITLLWDYIRAVTEKNQALLMGEKSGDVVRRLIRAHHDRHPTVLGASDRGVVGSDGLAAAQAAQLDVFFFHADGGQKPCQRFSRDAGKAVRYRTLGPKHRCGRRPSPVRLPHSITPCQCARRSRYWLGLSSRRHC